MKKLSILLILLLFLCIDAYSQKVAYAVFKDSTLTFYYNDKKPEGAYVFSAVQLISYFNSINHRFTIFDWRGGDGGSGRRCGDENGRASRCRIQGHRGHRRVSVNRAETLRVVL